MDGAQVRVLEQANEVGLGGFLQGKNGRSLEAKITLEILSDLTDETLEGDCDLQMHKSKRCSIKVSTRDKTTPLTLPDEEIGTLLVPTDLTEGDGPGPVTVGLLHSSGGRGGLAGSLGGELLAGGFASGRFAGGLLGTSHFGCCWLSICRDADL